MANLAEIIEYVKPRVMPTAKVALRVSGEYFDLEVESAVEAAMADLKRAGVAESCFDAGSDYYPLVRQAIVMYCKTMFGQDNPNEEMRIWLDIYKMCLDDLLNSGANAYAEEQDAEETCDCGDGHGADDSTAGEGSTDAGETGDVTPPSSGEVDPETTTEVDPDAVG